MISNVHGKKRNRNNQFDFVQHTNGSFLCVSLLLLHTTLRSFLFHSPVSTIIRKQNFIFKWFSISGCDSTILNSSTHLNLEFHITFPSVHEKSTNMRMKWQALLFDYGTNTKRPILMQYRPMWFVNFVTNTFNRFFSHYIENVTNESWDWNSICSFYASFVCILLIILIIYTKSI